MKTWPMLLLCCWLGSSLGQDNRLDNGARLCERDTRGLSIYTTAPRSSPGHLRFQVPCRPDDDHGYVEVGALAVSGDGNNPLFNEYLAWDDGLLVSTSWRVAPSEPANYVEVNARSLGSDRGQVELVGGRYGQTAVNVSARRIEHRFTDDFPFLFDGAGRSELALPDLLSPGTGSADEVRTVLLDRPEARSELQRDQVMIGLRHRLTPRTELSFSVLREQRDGTRPTTASNLFRSTSASGSLVELLEPIDYLTHELDLSLATQLYGWHLTAGYDGSFFENRSGELSWQNPFRNSRNPDALVVEQGRLDLYPDNRQHRFRLDAVRPLGDGGQWSVSASYLQMRQDDALLPHTINGGQIEGLQSIDLNNWNTVESLSQRRADAAIDALRFFTRGQGQLLDKLRWTAELSYYDEKNDTNFVNFNPLTGQFGALVQDGAFAATRSRDNGIFVPGQPGSNTQFRNIPFARSEGHLAAGLDWRLGQRTRLSTRYRYGVESRDFGQVEDLREQTLEARLTRRIGDIATARLNLEFADRSGDDYLSFPFAAFFSQSLPGYLPQFADGDPPFTLRSLRNSNLADRRTARVFGTAQVRLGDAVDLSVSGQVSDADYDVVDGLSDASERGINVELAYLPNSATRVFAYASYLRRNNDQSGVRDVRVSAHPIEVFPAEARWFVSSRDRDRSFGVGLQRQVGPVMFGVNYDYLDSSTGIQPAVASDLALSGAGSTAPEDLAFPAIAFKRQVLELQSLVPLRGGWSARVYLRFEEGQISEWRSDNLSPVIGNQYFLAAPLGDFRSRVYGLMLRRDLG